MVYVWGVSPYRAYKPRRADVCVNCPIDPFQTVCWGIVCTLISLTQNLTGLCIARVFLGITEAGLFPGLGYYISLWYKVQFLFGFRHSTLIDGCDWLKTAQRTRMAHSHLLCFDDLVW
jgi:MFS family permease